MLQIISTFTRLLRKGILLVAFVSLFNVVGWFGFLAQPSYAVTSSQETMSEIRKDLAEQDPQEAYEKALEVDKDPKFGIQKKYEENMKEYSKEHPDKGGLLEKTGEILDKVTGNN